MNGELAQLVCLATYGRRWLARPYDEPPPDPHLGNSTFRYVAEVRFGGGGRWTDVPSWLEGLRDRGAKALWLMVDPESPDGDLSPELAASFVGGGDWALVARTESGQELWRPAWRVTARGARDRRIWSVEYVGTGANVQVPVPSLDGAAAALRAALDEAQSFAREILEESWARWFGEALAESTFRFHPDMVPPDFPEERRRVVAMAERSWVFGGMGSWNDVANRSPEYRAVTHRLYVAVLHALAAAVNG